MLAYTDGKGRIGKGKGYYDRFFADIGRAERIGICDLGRQRVIYTYIIISAHKDIIRRYSLY